MDKSRLRQTATATSQGGSFSTISPTLFLGPRPHYNYNVSPIGHLVWPRRAFLCSNRSKLEREAPPVSRTCIWRRECRYLAFSLPLRHNPPVYCTLHYRTLIHAVVGTISVIRSSTPLQSHHSEPQPSISCVRPKLHKSIPERRDYVLALYSVLWLGPVGLNYFKIESSHVLLTVQFYSRCVLLYASYPHPGSIRLSLGSFERSCSAQNLGCNQIRSGPTTSL